MELHVEPESNQADIVMASDDKAEEPSSDAKAKFLPIPKSTDVAHSNRAVRSMSPMSGHVADGH